MTATSEHTEFLQLLAKRAEAVSGPTGSAFQSFPPGTVMLAGGMPDEDAFPLESLSKKAEEAILENGKVLLQYGQPKELTAWVADFMNREENIGLKPANILLTCGSSHAISLACRTFIDPGDIILVEAPTFMGALRTFRNAEARCLEVPLGDEGMDVVALEKKLKELKEKGEKVKFIYTIPTFHNPAGVTLGLEGRQRMLDLAVEYDVMILEDDAYHSLHYSGEVPPSMIALDMQRATNRVIHCRTFSKILAAGWRLGWIAAHPEIINRIQALKDDGATNLLGSYVAYKFAKDGELEEHIKKLVTVYKQKCDRMLAALERYMPADVRWNEPQGGFFVWLTLPEKVNVLEMLKKAVENQLVYVPGTSCYAEGKGGKNQLRLSFSFVKLNEIEGSIRKLGELIAAELN